VLPTPPALPRPPEPHALPRPHTPDGQAALQALIADPTHAALVLDFDGTLAPLVDDPQDSRPAPGAIPALRRLAPKVGHLAVLSGRPAATAAQLLGLDTEPALAELEVLGLYGVQHWQHGQLDSPPPAPGIATARERLQELLGHAPPGVHVEDKGLSLVVHTRPAAEPQQTLEELTPWLMALAQATGLEPVTGSYVLELRSPGPDKGEALLRYAEAKGPSALMYAGDDDGDLPVLATRDVLRGRGVPALVVCAARDGGPPTLAEQSDLVVDGPPGVVVLLEALADALA
jgi:trehalose 6-phosphate phosphatase